MTKYRPDQIRQWSAKARKRLDVIRKQSAADAIKMSSRTSAGVTRGGTVIQGFIPRMDGNLAASQIVQLKGTSAIVQKGGAYGAAVAAFTDGSNLTVTWPSAYARRRHNGFTGTDSLGRSYQEKGWHWVDKMKEAWPSIVNRNIKRAEALAP